jgi:oligoribonuclease
MEPVVSSITRRLLPGETPLFWIDIETTGLDPDDDIILEVGIRITNQNLLELARYTTLVMCVLPNTLSAIGRASQFVKDMHYKSGLTEDIKQLGLSEASHNFWPEHCEQAILGFINEFLGRVDWAWPRKPPMCGSSVQFDRSFLAKHMPILHDFFDYRQRDVSSVKEWCVVLNPKIAAHLKEEEAAWVKVHRPQADLDASIREMKFYIEEFLLVDSVIDIYEDHDPAQQPLF